MAFVASDSGPYISKLGMQNNTYTIKDKWARDEIAEIEKAIAGGVHFRGVSITAIADGDSLKQLNVGTVSEPVNITVDEQADGDIFIYNNGTKNLEFIVSGGKYSELGSTGNLGSFAYANSGAGSVTIPIASAFTFNTFTPDVGLGTLAVTYSTGTVSIGTTPTAATGTFSPAAITIPGSSVTFTPTKTQFTALKNVTYDSTTATLTITDGSSDEYWTGATGGVAAQTVTPTANQSISVTYDKVNSDSIVALTSAALTGSLSITGAKPTATITDPSVTVTVTPISS